MEIALGSIEVTRPRMRAERPVGELAESMAIKGQLQEIVVEEAEEGHYGLVIGLHRLRAAKLLGWETIRADVRRFESPEWARLCEIAENLVRNELSALERIEHVAERARILKEIGLIKGQGRPTKKALESSAFLKVSQLSGELGIGQSTLRWYRAMDERLSHHAKECIRGSRFENNLTEIDRISRLGGMERVAVLMQLDAEKQGAKPSPGGVKDIQRDLKRAQTRRLGLQTSSPNGRFHTIVVDPPWASEISGDVSGAAGSVAPPYETMSLARICHLPLAAWEEKDDDGQPDVHLYLWVTHGTWAAGMEVLAAWGYDLKHVIVWEKNRITPGRYFDHIHELCLFAAKGNRLPAYNVPDVFEGKRLGPHSTKPEEFYEIVEKISPGPRLEMFARKQREGWSTWGAEVKPNENGSKIADAAQRWGAASVAVLSMLGGTNHVVTHHLDTLQMIFFKMLS